MAVQVAPPLPPIFWFAFVVACNWHEWLLRLIITSFQSNHGVRDEAIEMLITLGASSSPSSPFLPISLEFKKEKKKNKPLWRSALF